MAVNGFAAAQDVAALKTGVSALALAMGTRVGSAEDSIEAVAASISGFDDSLLALENSKASINGSNVIPAAFREAIGANLGDNVIASQETEDFTDRSVGSKLREVMSAGDWPLIGDGVTDNGAQVNAFLNVARFLGRDAVFPSGNFRYSVPISVTLSASMFNGEQGFSIRGSSGSTTTLTFVGDALSDAVTIIGSHPGADKFALVDVRIQRPNIPLAATLGSGLVLRTTVGAEIRNSLFYNHGDGIRMEGSLHLSFRDVLVAYCHSGIVGEYLGISGPNAIQLDSVSIISARDVGIDISQGCQINIANTTIEGTGTHPRNGDDESAYPASSSVGIKLSNCGREGGVVINTTGGLYMENNRGVEVLIAPDEHMGTYELGGTNFNRFAPTKPMIQFDTTNLTAGNAKTKVMFDRATCRIYGTAGSYTPSDATAVFKMVGGGSYDGLTVIDQAFQYANANVSGNTYQTTADRPSYGSHKVRRALETITPTYNAGWSSLGTVDLKITRDLDGWITMQGAVGGGTTTDGTVMFTLPVGYRPLNASHRFVVVKQGDVSAVVYVSANGNVQLFGAVGAGFVFLDGIRYLAEQ